MSCLYRSFAPGGLNCRSLEGNNVSHSASLPCLIKNGHQASPTDKLMMEPEEQLNPSTEQRLLQHINASIQQRSMSLTTLQQPNKVRLLMR